MSKALSVSDKTMSTVDCGNVSIMVARKAGPECLGIQQ